MHRSDFPELPPALGAALREQARARGGLSPDLPGLVYEQSRAGDRTERRAHAVYYTPPHLVDFVVERTLGPLVSRAVSDAGRVRRRGTSAPVRVLDPACGGGAFLLAALERLHRVGMGSRRAILRDCLAGIDIDPQAVAVTRLALALAVPEAPRRDIERAVVLGDALRPGAAARLLAERAAAAGADRAFDAVVTNPPWGQKGFRLTAEDRRHYRATFASARGALDPFALFVERAHQLLPAGGRWGMVLPDVVLLKNHERLRRLVLAGSALEHIAHAGQAFAGVNLDAVVMIGRTTCGAPPPARHRVSIWHRLPETWRERPPRTHHQRQAVFARLPAARINLHLSPRDLALYDRLAALPRLGSRFEAHEGVHSGNARAKLFLPARPSGRRGRTAAPLVLGRGEVARYHLAWAGRWIDLSPDALDRAAGDYANLGRPEWHVRPKIVVRRTGDHLVAAFDPDGLYVSNNLFVVMPRASARPAELPALVAVLNSRLLTWAFRVLVPRVGRLFAELKIQHLVELPLPPAERWTRSAVEGLAELSRRRAAAAQGSAAATRIEAEIDERVETLYQLVPAERRHIKMRGA